MDEKTLAGGGVQMTHFTKEQWERFGQGGLALPIERKMEDHLTVCNQCLFTFEEVSLQHDPPPEFNVEDLVMAAISADQTETVRPMTKPSSHLRKKTIDHFLITAAAAIMLASTGVFSSLVDERPSVPSKELIDTPSITSSLMEQTERLFNQMDPSPKEELE